MLKIKTNEMIHRFTAVMLIALMSFAGVVRTTAQIPEEVHTKAPGVQKLLSEISSFVNGKRDSARFETLLLDGRGQNGTNMLKLADSWGKGAAVLKGFGVTLGLGLALADTFHLFGPTAEEQNAAALKEISGKIDNLQATMNAGFDRLEENLSNKIEVESARTQIRGNLNRLSAVQNNMELWTNLLNEKELNFAAIDDQERQMTTGTTPAQIYEAVNGVYEQVLGENLATVLMEADYKTTYGDMNHIVKLSTTLKKLVESGEVAYETVSTMQLRRGNEDKLRADIPNAEERTKFQDNLTAEDADAIASNAAKKFGPLIEGIAKKMESYTIRSVRERDVNVKAYMEHTYGGFGNLTRKKTYNNSWTREGTVSKENAFKRTITPALTTTDFEKKWGTLANELKSKYFCDWLVVAYHPIQRPDGNHDSGFPSYTQWNWIGSNYIWFQEYDHDFDVPSPLMFLLLKWTDSETLTQRQPLVPRTTSEWFSKISYGGLPGLTQAELDTVTEYPYDEIETLYKVLGEREVTNVAGTHTESGAVLEFSNWYGGGDVKIPPFSIKYTAELGEDGCVIQVDDSKNGEIMPRPYGKFGALYLKTTNTNRLGIQNNGTKKLIILYR